MIKLITFLTATVSATALLLSVAPQFNVGNVFAQNIRALRANYAMAPQPALAETALDDFNVRLKQDIIRERERLMKAWEQQTLNDYIEQGMKSVFADFVNTDSRCQEGKRLLSIRWSKATNTTLDNVTDWVGYVRRRYCMTLPPVNTRFSQQGLAEYRQTRKDRPYFTEPDTSALAASSDS